MKEEKLNKIKTKIHRKREKQIGGIRFDVETYDKIVEISKELDVTKQWFIQQIVIDFIFEK